MGPGEAPGAPPPRLAAVMVLVQIQHRRYTSSSTSAGSGTSENTCSDPELVAKYVAPAQLLSQALPSLALLLPAPQPPTPLRLHPFLHGCFQLQQLLLLSPVVGEGVAAGGAGQLGHGQVSGGEG